MQLDPERLREMQQFLDFCVQARKRLDLSGIGHYLCMEDFVMQEGTGYLKVSPDHPGEYKRNRYRTRMPRQCFDNAYKAAVASRGKLRYVEGYAHGGFMPVHHAWNIDTEGRIVDTTWCGDGEDRGYFTRPPLGSAYMGVVFDVPFVRNLRTDNNTCVIDRWDEGWPVLRQKYINPLREAVTA